jgi:ankyrin repeat protein
MLTGEDTPSNDLDSLAQNSTEEIRIVQNHHVSRSDWINPLGSSSTVGALDRNWELIQAARTGNLTEAKHLLNLGTNVNAIDPRGLTVLMVACANGQHEVARVLLDEKADVNATSKWGTTALIEASNNGHVEIVRLLLEREQMLMLRTLGVTQPCYGLPLRVTLKW